MLRRVGAAFAVAVIALLGVSTPALAKPSPDPNPADYSSVLGSPSEQLSGLVAVSNTELWVGTREGKLFHVYLDASGQVFQVDGCWLFDAPARNIVPIYAMDIDRTTGSMFIASGPTWNEVSMIPYRALVHCGSSGQIEVSSSVTVDDATDVKVHGSQLFALSRNDKMVYVYEFEPSLVPVASISLDLNAPTGLAIGSRYFAVVDSVEPGRIEQLPLSDIVNLGGGVSPAPELIPDVATTITGTEYSNGMGRQRYIAYGCNGSLVATGEPSGAHLPLVQFSGQASGTDPDYLKAFAGSVVEFANPEAVAFDPAGRMWVVNNGSGVLARFDNRLSCNATSATSLSNTGTSSGGTVFVLALASLLVASGVALRYARRSIQ